ncbi:MAG: rhomboid family intramembrane serine protease [Bacteroidota bacterium]|nr:rhomboid family intramembrane serine protease [Bacteroidota bacterium]
MRPFANSLGGGLPVVVKNLLIINGLFFLLKMSFGTDQLGYNELDRMLAMHPLDSPLFKPWQLVTHMFMHGGLGHLFLNMFALFMFGGPIERLFGSKRFLIYYFATGMGAVALHTGVHFWEVQSIKDDLLAYGVQPSDVKPIAAIAPYDLDEANAQLNDLVLHTGAPETAIIPVFRNYISIMLGASGAVFGVLLAFGMMFPNTELFLLFPPIPIKAKYFVIGYGLLSLYQGYTGLQGRGDNVAHFAHLGGMVFGFFIIRHWQRSHKI